MTSIISFHKEFPVDGQLWVDELPRNVRRAILDTATDYQEFLNSVLSSTILDTDGIIGPLTAKAHYRVFGTRLEGDPLA